MHHPSDQPSLFPDYDAASRHLACGRALLDVGRAEQALKEFTRAAALDPQSFRPRLYLSYAAYQAGRNEDALRFIDDALHLRPDYCWLHSQRFYVLRTMKRKSEAHEAACRAVALAPEQESMLYALILSYLDLQQTADAEAVVQQLQQIAPGDYHTHIAAALTFRALRRWQDAETSARAALGLNAESACAFRYLGDSLWEQDRRPEAYKAYKEAGLLSPNDSELKGHIERRVASRVFPPVLVAGTQAVSIIGTALVCWTTATAIGHAAVGWVLALVYLVVTTAAFVVYEGMYLIYWRRSEWKEIPTPVQTFLWRARAVSLPGAYCRPMVLAITLTLIVLACLCAGWPIEIVLDRSNASRTWAWASIVLQGLFLWGSISICYRAEDTLIRVKPPETLDAEEVILLQKANAKIAKRQAKSRQSPKATA